MDPRIQIRIQPKMSWICNTMYRYKYLPILICRLTDNSRTVASSTTRTTTIRDMAAMDRASSVLPSRLHPPHRYLSVLHHSLSHFHTVGGGPEKPSSVLTCRVADQNRVRIHFYHLNADPDPSIHLNADPSGLHFESPAFHCEDSDANSASQNIAYPKRIRIRYPAQGFGSGSALRGKSRNFMFCAESSLLRAEGFSCSLGV
jgi:hypothetical protein